MGRLWTPPESEREATIAKHARRKIRYVNVRLACQGGCGRVDRLRIREDAPPPRPECCGREMEKR